MPKVVINNCHGGFGISHAATMRYAEIKGITLFPFVRASAASKADLVPYDGAQARPLGMIYYFTTPDGARGSLFHEDNIPRDDPALLQVVEEMGWDANTEFACLKVVEVPDDVEWEIAEYDGSEWVAEKHRTWD